MPNEKSHGWRVGVINVTSPRMYRAVCFFGNPPCLRVECALALFHLFPRHTTLSFKVDKLDVEKCIQACILFYYLKSPCFYFVLRKRFLLECRIPDRSTYVRYKFLLTRNAGHRYYTQVCLLSSLVPPYFEETISIMTRPKTLKTLKLIGHCLVQSRN